MRNDCITYFSLVIKAVTFGIAFDVFDKFMNLRFFVYLNWETEIIAELQQSRDVMRDCGVGEVNEPFFIYVS